MDSGEEFITAAICIPLAIVLVKHLPKNIAIIISILVSSMVFGAIYLPAYNWNLYQALVIIELIRLPFTVLWFKAKSLWGKLSLILSLIISLSLFLPYSYD